jgi:YVTN family beta-propeller protein
MAELPTGTVTFLFTDIEGSTRLLKLLRDGYGAVVAEHRHLLRAAFAEHGGAEIDSQGDSFFVAFRRAKHAVAAAAAAQRALQAHDWPEGAQVRVRMGIHTGEAEFEDGRYHGIAVHRGARIMAAAHGGQVLLSQTTRDVLEDEEADQPSLSLRDLGEQRLKDLDRPVRLYQLVIAGIPSGFPSLRGVGPPQSRPARGLLKRRRAVLGAGLVTAAGLTAGLVLALDHSANALSAVDPNSVGVLDATGRHINAQVPVGDAPTGVAYGDGAIWVTNAESNTVSRIDPTRNDVRQTIDVGVSPSGIAVGNHAVWVANSYDGMVSRIDTATNHVVQCCIRVGSGPAGVAYGAGSVWVTNANDGTVSRIDSRSGETIRTIPAGAGAGAIAFGEGSVWVANKQTGSLSQIDPGTNDVVQTIYVGNGPSAVAVGAGSVWVANGLDGTVSRINPETPSVADTIHVDAGPRGLGVSPDGGAVWVSNEFSRTVSQIEPSRNEVVRTLEVGNQPEGIAVNVRGAPFVAVRASAGSHRGGTLRLQTATPDVGPVDTATGGPALNVLATSDGLTTYKKVGGVDGTQLVPDLATSLPVPTDGGKTYTFHLQRGVRYSTGALVEPQDSRRGIERVFALQTKVKGACFACYYTGIVGAAACQKEAEHCDLSKGIVANADRHMVTFHLISPDPEFLDKLAQPAASAVPAGLPAKEFKRDSFPATGPYKVTSYTKREVKLVRNPYFREWSKGAQPDGFPDKIVWKLGVSPKTQVRRLLRGQADGVLSQAPPELVPRLETEYPSQVHIDPVAATDWFFLNTRVPPFNDVRVRRALNYATDRNEVVALPGFGQPFRPTCQVLPPNFPGYKPYCPYTLDRSPSGEPDLIRARQLVKASRTAGTRVTVWACSPSKCFENPSIGRYFVSLLNSLGYRARLKVVPDFLADYLPAVLDSRRRIQAGSAGWGADFPTASNFINTNLSCSSFHPASRSNGNMTEFCDRKIDGEIRRAVRLRITDPVGANELWAKIDHEIIDQSPLVPLGNPISVDILSKRVGNYQYNPFWRMLIDQVWVQ